jgi:hypothetical protein
MKCPKRRLHVISVAVTALLLGVAAPASFAGAETPFGVADIFLELNDTDGDLGIHALIDGEPWRVLAIESPDEREKLRVTASGTLRQHGLTELFFESAEPSFDELPPAQFFQRFPAGEWEVEGITIEGDELESTDVLSHVLAAPPENILVSGEEAAESCDVVPLPSVSEPVVISWDPVTESHPEIGETGKVEVVKYQLVVERLEPTPLIFSVDLPPDVTEFEVPEGFIALGEEFKFEILVREATGNQTAVESCFELE